MLIGFLLSVEETFGCKTSGFLLIRILLAIPRMGICHCSTQSAEGLTSKCSALQRLI